MLTSVHACANPAAGQELPTLQVTANLECGSASGELGGECQRLVRQISREDQVSAARLQRLFRLLNEANCGVVLCPPIRAECPEIDPTEVGVGASDDSANRSFDLYFCHRRRRL